MLADSKIDGLKREIVKLLKIILEKIITINFYYRTQSNKQLMI
jgi:hypothetical protein